VSENLNEKYKKFRNYIHIEDANLKKQLKKDKNIGPMIVMDDLICKLDKQNEKLQKIKESIKAIELKLIPVIKKAIIGQNKVMQERINEENEMAERVSILYDDFIRGNHDLETHYNGPIPNPNNSIEYLTADLNYSNIEIGVVEEGVFKSVPKTILMEENPLGKTQYIVKMYDENNPEVYTYSILVSFARVKDSIKLLICITKDELISDNYPLFSLDMLKDFDHGDV